MENTARKALNTSGSISTGGSLADKLKNTYTDELILGICTHIGSKRDIVVEQLKKILEVDYKYTVQTIKLSDFISYYYKEKDDDLKGKTEGYARMIHKIEGGNHLRKKYDSNSLLAQLAINKILQDRILESSVLKGDLGIPFKLPIADTDMTSRRVCYIIDSLKNKEELDILRIVYRDIFYLFSIYTPENECKENLIRKKKGLSAEEAEEIIKRDEYENIGEHGQNVRDTFVEADFFIRSSNSNEAKLKDIIKRYLHLIFNSKIVTPLHEETAMYFAKSASGNSACMSRQVGATITDKNGVPLAQGWNDVPKCGGNLYNDSDEYSKQCHINGVCSNVIHRNDIIDEIMKEIEGLVLPEENTDKILSLTKPSETTSENKMLIPKIENIIRASKFKSIIEYSRSIHAEMHAIIIGSQMTGNKMIGGKLYCTTYPCHNCARHIVLAGIKEIYYIEPYKKSLCLELHNDSLTEDENDDTKVRILPYEGVAPRRYLDFFTMVNDDRKNNDGTIKKVNLDEVIPKKRLSLQSLPLLEKQAVISLDECGILKVSEYEGKERRFTIKD